MKAITGSSWQFGIRRFAEVTPGGRKQVVDRAAKLKRDIVCVPVALADYGSDRRYNFRWSDLRKIAVTHHRDYLAKAW